MSKYVVTGATGHIGNTLVRTLVERGEKVKALQRKSSDITNIKDLNIEIALGELDDVEFLEKEIETGDIVIHSAGKIEIGKGNKKEVFRTNVDETKVFVDFCCKKNIKKLIYVSSVDAIKKEKTGKIVEPEVMELKGLKSAYAQSKAIATDYVINLARLGKIDAVVVYPSAVIGPYDFKVSCVGQVIKDYLEKGILGIVKGKYNFVDVRDVVDGIINAISYGRSGEGYILGGEEMTIRELFITLNTLKNTTKVPHIFPLPIVLGVTPICELYFKLRNKKPVFSSYAIKTLNSNCDYSLEKARNELYYKPRGAKESVLSAANWFVENGLCEINKKQKDKKRNKK